MKNTVSQKIGILGGGQLAQMLALAGYPLALKCISLETSNICPAAQVTEVIVGKYADPIKLQALAQAADVLTYEFENIPTETLSVLSALKTPPVYPPLSALAIAQDRLHEKDFFNALKVPTTQYFSVDTLADLEKAAAQLQYSAVVKTRRWGYDGKGQAVIQCAEDVLPAWQQLQDQPLLIENKIVFDREVSCIAVRSVSGALGFYPVIQNHHQAGILRFSEVLPEDDPITQLAQKYVRDILTELQYVGVLTVEFFQQNDALIANEMAPRVHNSGHWTIEGAEISQFENHLRAILDLPLGSTKVKGHVAMINLIGNSPSLAEILEIPEAHCHLYGKEARVGRKLGHVTLCVENREVYKKQLGRLQDICL